jgi:hypothetical protein
MVRLIGCSQIASQEQSGQWHRRANGITFRPFSTTLDGYRFEGAGGWALQIVVTRLNLHWPTARRQSNATPVSGYVSSIKPRISVQRISEEEVAFVEIKSALLLWKNGPSGNRAACLPLLVHFLHTLRFGLRRAGTAFTNFACLTVA